jgi:hypothetical protein
VIELKEDKTMKGTKIVTRVATTVNIGNYENYRFECEMEVPTGDNPEVQAFNYGWAQCMKQIKEQKSFLLQNLKAQKTADNPHGIGQ